MFRRCFPLALVLALFAAPARAGEVIQLLDNTQMAGRILHYFDGVFQIELADGKKIDVPRDKVKSITFKLPAPRTEFSTPEKTFQGWREALNKGAVERVIDTYALMCQGVLAQQLSADEFKKMQKEIEGTRFDLKGAKVAGPSATLKVQRTKGDDVMTAELRFVLENGEWKMTCPFGP